MSKQRVGDWMQTYSGKKFWPLDPRPAEIRFEDIAVPLSILPRFGGHCRLGSYTVGQHSVLLSRALEEAGESQQTWLWGLLDDSPEAYIGDMIRPLKHQAAMEQFRQAETAIKAAVAIKFGLPADVPPVVKTAEMRLLATEYRDLMRPGLHWAGLEGVEPYDFEITPWQAAWTLERFRQRFKEIVDVAR